MLSVVLLEEVCHGGQALRYQGHILLPFSSLLPALGSRCELPAVLAVTLVCSDVMDSYSSGTISLNKPFTF